MQRFLILLLLLGCFHLGCTQTIQEEPNRQNAPEQLSKPYVILISLDGFRWDYVSRFKPPHLSKFIEGGVQAESLIPCFPSKTFPNHYCIATGMVPERHGLVDNNFYLKELDAVYTMSKREMVENGKLYGGTPLWVLAEQQGMVSASYFFVGSEADVKGIRPSYWVHYNGRVPEETRVQQALDWLQLPEAKRPHFITLYFSNMDDAGHSYGPNNDEKLSAALAPLDQALGKLFDGVAALKLPVNIIIVSDHGMTEVANDHFIPTEPLLDDEKYIAVNNGPLIHFYLKEGVNKEEVFQTLQARAPASHCKVFKTEDFPFYRDSISNQRLGDLIALVDHPYYFVDSRRLGFLSREGGVKGEHGFDPAIRDLQGIFYANGPQIKAGLTIPSFKNVHIYPLVCRLLGLQIPEGIDGKAEVLETIIN